MIFFSILGQYQLISLESSIERASSCSRFHKSNNPIVSCSRDFENDPTSHPLMVLVNRDRVVGKFGAVFASIPFPIYAALYCVLFGLVGTASLTSHVKENSSSKFE